MLAILLLGFVAHIAADRTGRGQDNLSGCCARVGLSGACQRRLCKYDIGALELACTLPECHTHLDQFLFCASDGRNQVNSCCRGRNVPTQCMQFCEGSAPPTTELLRDDMIACGFAAPDILTCFQESLPLSGQYMSGAAPLEDLTRLSAETAKHLRGLDALCGGDFENFDF